jgi:hypothetical protein
MMIHPGLAAPSALSESDPGLLSKSDPLGL